MAGSHNEEPELIETIITELDSSTFALALAGGAIIGGFLLYLFMQRDKIAKPQEPKQDDDAKIIALAHKLVDERLEIARQDAPAEADDSDNEQAIDTPWAPPAFMGSQG